MQTAEPQLEPLVVPHFVGAGAVQQTAVFITINSHKRELKNQNEKLFPDGAGAA
jgi:hypothetical protein